MKIKNILFALLLSLVSALVFFLVAELATRMFWDIGYRHKYDWRDRTEGYSRKKAKGTFRILVLGDSVAYGQGVGRDDCFPKILENLLNANSRKGEIKKYEVINSAWPGINTVNQFNTFFESGLQLYPDMVLVAYFLNDVGPPASYRLQRIDIEDPLYIRRPINRDGWEWRLPLPEAVDANLTRYSDFYYFVMRRYDSFLRKHKLRTAGPGADTLPSQYKEESASWKITEHALGTIYRLCEKNGKDAVLAILPFFHVLDNYKYKEIHRQVRDASEAIGYEVLDLLPLFEDKKSEEFIVSRIDTHPNEKAHKMIADALYKFIKERELLEK